MAKKTFENLGRGKEVQKMIKNIGNVSEELKESLSILEDNPSINSYSKAMKITKGERIEKTQKNGLITLLKEKYSGLEQQYKIIQDKYVIGLIDYEVSRDITKLDADRLVKDIYKLDKNSFEYLIIKCQRLSLLGRHKFYKKLGYSNVEEMALDLFNIKRIQYHKYVSIWDKLENMLYLLLKNVQSTEHFEELSLEKLYLIARIEEDNKINEWFDKIVETNYSVKELKTELQDKHLLPEKSNGLKKYNVKKKARKFLSEMPIILDDDQDRELSLLLENLFLNRLYMSKSDKERKVEQMKLLEKLMSVVEA